VLILAPIRPCAAGREVVFGGQALEEQGEVGAGELPSVVGAQRPNSLAWCTSQAAK